MNHVGVIIIIISVVSIVGSFSFLAMITTNSDDVVKQDYTVHYKTFRVCGWDDNCWVFNGKMSLYDGQSIEDGNWMVRIDANGRLYYVYVKFNGTLPTKEELCYQGIDLSLNENCDILILHDDHEMISNKLKMLIGNSSDSIDSSLTNSLCSKLLVRNGEGLVTYDSMWDFIGCQYGSSGGS